MLNLCNNKIYLLKVSMDSEVNKSDLMNKIYNEIEDIEVELDKYVLLNKSLSYKLINDKLDLLISKIRFIDMKEYY